MAIKEFLETFCLAKYHVVMVKAFIASSQPILGSAIHPSYYSSYPDFKPKIVLLIVDLPVYS